MPKDNSPSNVDTELQAYASPDLLNDGGFDTNIVTWSAHGDSENPQNWTRKKKWLLTMSLSTHSLGTSMASSIVAPGIQQIAAHFNVSLTVATLTLSLYVLGWATGPMVFSPISEIYGRKIVMAPSAICFVAFLIGCAFAQNIETLLVCRAFAGIFSSPINSVAAGFVYDIFPPSEVGPALFYLTMCAFLGPALGPLAGGFLTEYEGWRWIMRFLVIYNGADLAIWLWIPETHGNTILARKARDLRKRTGNKSLMTSYEQRGLKKSAIMKVAIWRPLQLLVLEPIVLLTALFISIIWGILYLYLGAYPIVFGLHYHWREGPAGAAFMGIGVGVLLSIFAAGYANKLHIKLSDKHGGEGKFPEGRLPLAMIAAVLAPISVFWFGWTGKQGTTIHWIVPVLSGIPFGWCMVMIFICCLSYTTDCFPEISASAIAANSFLRSLTAMSFPLFTPNLFERLKTEWAISLLGFITVALVPIPFLLWKFGARIRARSRFRPRYT